MGSTLRFILRLLIVPLGLLAAVIAATLVAGMANWERVFWKPVFGNTAP